MNLMNSSNSTRTFEKTRLFYLNMRNLWPKNETAHIHCLCCPEISAFYFKYANLMWKKDKKVLLQATKEMLLLRDNSLILLRHSLHSLKQVGNFKFTWKFSQKMHIRRIICKDAHGILSIKINYCLLTTCL